MPLKKVMKSSALFCSKSNTLKILLPQSPSIIPDYCQREEIQELFPMDKLLGRSGVVIGRSVFIMHLLRYSSENMWQRNLYSLAVTSEMSATVFFHFVELLSCQLLHLGLRTNRPHDQY